MVLPPPVLQPVLQPVLPPVSLPVLPPVSVSALVLQPVSVSALLRRCHIQRSRALHRAATPDHCRGHRAAL